MAAPAVIAGIGAGLALMSLLANIRAQKKQQTFLEDQTSEQRKQARRAAIQRAMGGSFYSRRPKISDPPDTSNQAIISGLANIGSQTLPRLMQQQPKYTSPYGPTPTWYKP